MLAIVSNLCLLNQLTIIMQVLTTRKEWTLNGELQKLKLPPSWCNRVVVVRVAILLFGSLGLDNIGNVLMLLMYVHGLMSTNMLGKGDLRPLRKKGYGGSNKVNAIEVLRLRWE